MSATLKADGDTWRAKLGGAGADRAVVFFCESTDQRPYRVVPAGERFDDATDLSGVSAEDLRDLYDRSRSMGAPVDYPTYGS